MLLALKQKVSGLTLVPSRGGVFEVVVDGELVYSKVQTGRFPDESEVLSAVQSRLAKA